MNPVKIPSAGAAKFAALAALLCLSGMSRITAQIVIDGFQQSQATITGTASSTQAGSMIGGERDLALSVSTGAISAGVSLGVLKISGDGAANGTVEAVWDGADNDATTISNSGLGGTNLGGGGDNALLLGINSLSGSPTLTLTVFSGATSSTITLSGLAASTLPQVVRLPYSAFTGSASFSSVGAIRLQISSLANATVELDFLRTGSATAPAPVETLLTDVVLIDNDGNGKASAGDRLKYVLTIKNNSGSTLTNVQVNLPAVGNATLDGASLTLTPLARSDGPTGTSIPGDNFHTPFNTALTVADGSAQDLMNNDSVGAPAASISRFGGGTLGGAVDDHNAGSTVNSGGHSLTVNPDGSF